MITLTLAEDRARSPLVSGWYQVEGLPVAVFVSGVQGVLEALFHREAGCNHQETPGEPVVVRGGVPVVRGVVEDQHRHHWGLPGGSRHLVCDPEYAVVVPVVYPLGFLP